jgi:hypothetical protein
LPLDEDLFSDAEPDSFEFFVADGDEGMAEAQEPAVVPDSPAPRERIIDGQLGDPAWPNHTVLLRKVVTDWLHFGVSSNMSRNNLDRMFRLLQRTLPRDNQIPSYQQAVKIF